MLTIICISTEVKKVLFEIKRYVCKYFFKRIKEVLKNDTISDYLGCIQNSVA